MKQMVRGIGVLTSLSFGVEILADTEGFWWQLLAALSFGVALSFIDWRAA